MMPPKPSPLPVPDQNANISTIELLRGLAATLVCFYHFTHGNNTFISDQNWVKHLFSKGWLGVEIFFVISGFIIPYSMARSRYEWRNYPYFILKRWVRIDPPYLLSIIFVLLLNAAAALWLVKSPAFELRQVLLHVGYLLPFFPPLEWLNGVYWTLAIEFQYYLLIGLLFPLLYHPQRIYFWLVTMGLLSIAWLTSNPAMFFDFSMYFVLGFALFRRVEKQMGNVEFLIFSAIAFYVIEYKFSLQFMLAGMFPWFLIAFFPSLHAKALRWLGMISYSLYLIHLPLGKKLIPLIARYVEGDWPRLGMLGLLFCFTLALAYGFYYLIERPAMRWSKFFKYGGKSKSTAESNQLPPKVL